MNKENIIDYILEIDVALEEIESAILHQNNILAIHKLKNVREVIDDLRQEDCAMDDREIDMHIMQIIR